MTDSTSLEVLAQAFDAALNRFASGQEPDPQAAKSEVLARAGELLTVEDGPVALYVRVAQIESAGLFAGTDWAQPSILVPGLAQSTLRRGDYELTVIEALSELRLLAVALGDYFHPGISAEQASSFITQVMALNLDLLSGQLNEADRERPHNLGQAVMRLYQFLVAHMGYASIIDSLVAEVWRILDQRPIQVDGPRRMIVQIAQCLYDQQRPVSQNPRAAQLVQCLFAPTPGCAEDPGLAVYQQRLAAMQPGALADEARSFGSAMHASGLASVYHAAFLRHLRSLGDPGNALILTALGLSSTGTDALLCYSDLVYTLIDEAIFVETAQAIYGLARLLERGALYSRPLTAALWRQLRLPLSASTNEMLRLTYGEAQEPRVFLLAGVLNLLGQPLGVGQGNNPTCQSVIGVSMWADNDPDYLLQLVAWAGRDDEILTRFEGETVSSRGLEAGLAKTRPLDVDAVSMLIVPHLDRIYMEMGRLCGPRDDDLHKWINPAFYGWWVGQGFRVVADAKTGRISNHESFIRQFYAHYHPYVNGGLPVIHPQPAGIAVTDSGARYVGRHAITIRRVGLDPHSVMRVYFFNPNNDSGQDWGQGIVTATFGHGELYGEASLPFVEFASRLFVFHYDPLEGGDPKDSPADEIRRATTLARESWAGHFE